MRRLIVCADGTWNKPDDDQDDVEVSTNVVRIQRAIKAVDDNGTSQICFYHSGVGTGDAIDKILGGVAGEGLDRNILECYAFLVNNYVEGDEIYLFGFSRGAYTVRSLSGLIRNSGIVKQSFASMAPEAFSLYRDRDPTKGPNSDAAVIFRAGYSHDPVPITCIGVWDTVGALGIPVGIFAQFSEQRYLFHDVGLSSRVQNAFHALAIDEHRKPFVPTLWEQPVADAVGGANWLEQAWFAGVHSNVGGGYPDTGLSSLTLAWMIERVSDRCGLRFDEAAVAQLATQTGVGKMYDSMNVFYQALGAVQRGIDASYALNLARGVYTWEYVHQSVRDRITTLQPPQPGYDPANLEQYTTRADPPPLFQPYRAIAATVGAPVPASPPPGARVAAPKVAAKVSARTTGTAAKG